MKPVCRYNRNMIQQQITIHRIPAVVWGDKADNVFLAVHGNSSHKEDVVIEILARIAVQNGYQVLSFDLPEHGERKDEDTLCKVQVCVQELGEVLAYAQSRWKEISLFACSMGAYFSLLAYRDAGLNKALFLSPVVDMEQIIRNMMTWFSVTPERLEKEQSIETPVGQTLYWDYFRYVLDHPVDTWSVDTRILYGKKDTLVEYDTISQFSGTYQAQLELVEDGEHYFHTDDQLAVYARWVEDQIRK